MLNDIRRNRFYLANSPDPQTRQTRQAQTERPKHILVPTRLERTDFPALFLGIQMATMRPHRMTVLHVQPESVQREVPYGLDAIRLLHQSADLMHGRSAPDDSRTPTESEHQKIRSFLEATIPDHVLHGVDLRVECRTGNVADGIVKFAEDREADVVIMSGEFKSSWWPVLPTCIRRVLRQTRRQVILVRAVSERTNSWT